MQIKNITEAPNPYPDNAGTHNPPAELLHAAGYRVMPEQPPIVDGYTRLGITAIELDGINGQWRVVDKLTSEIEAEKAQARIDDFVAKGFVPKAAAFKQLMRMYFATPEKPEAELNRDITKDVVEAYFLTAPDLTVVGVQHGIALQGLFAQLTSWSGTNPPETWTLPWEIVP